MSEQENIKQAAMGQLANFIEPEVIANDLNIPLSRVKRYSRELKEAQAAGAVDELLTLGVDHIDPATLTEQTKDVLDGVKGLERLQLATQQTAMVINNKVKILASSVDSAGELETLTACLCRLQDAFFNNNKAPQLNIQNNFGQETGQATYGNFLSDKPADK